MWMWLVNQVSRVHNRSVQFINSASVTSSIYSVITVIFTFKSLFSACYSNIVFNLVSTWKWPVIKFPESQDAQSNKEFSPSDGHKHQSRNLYDFSRFFKLRSRDGSTRPTVFPTIYKSTIIFYATNVYALCQGAQDGLDCE